MLTPDSPDGFKDHPAHLPQTPVHRAASLVRAVMLFREQLKLGTLQPEATKEGPICMDSYRWVPFPSLSRRPLLVLLILY